MTPAQSQWISDKIAAGVQRHNELVAKRASLADWPRSAWEDPPALLIYADAALFAWYLAADGRVFVHDMDRFAQEVDEVTDPAKCVEVYQRARELFPELAGL